MLPLWDSFVEVVSTVLMTLIFAWMAFFLLSVTSSFTSSDMKVVRRSDLAEEEEEGEEEGGKEKEGEKEKAGKGEDGKGEKWGLSSTALAAPGSGASVVLEGSAAGGAGGAGSSGGVGGVGGIGGVGGVGDVGGVGGIGVDSRDGAGDGAAGASGGAGVSGKEEGGRMTEGERAGKVEWTEEEERSIKDKERKEEEGKEEEGKEEEEDEEWEGLEETSELEEKFNAAATFVVASVSSQPQQQASAGSSSSPQQMLEGTQLMLYSLYKQATEGQCTTAQPPFYSLKARAKWGAWKQLEAMSSEEAMEKYVKLVGDIFPEFNEAVDDEPGTEPGGGSSKSGGGGGGGEGGGGGASAGGRSVSTFQYEEGHVEGSDGQHSNKLIRCAVEGDIAGLALELVDASKETVNITDEEGRTALHWATDRGHLEAARLLLENGADPNGQDSEGQTALHYAAVCEHEELAKFLLGEGANESMADSDGKTPADYFPSGWK